MQSPLIKGFTLSALLIALSIAVILITIAIPSYTNFIQKNKSVMLANQLVTDLNTARVNALSTGFQVSLCPIQKSATTTCGNATQWNNGWVVLSDPNNQYTYTASSLLRESHFVDTAGVIFSITPSISQVGYNALGALSTPPFTLTIRPASCKGSQVQIISVSSSGQVSKETGRCS